MAAIYQWFDPNFIQGLCISSNDLIVTDVLTPTIMPREGFIGFEQDAPHDLPGVTGLERSKYVAFTAVFVRTSPPLDANYWAPIIHVYNTGAAQSRFRLYLDHNGHVRVRAWNSSGTQILNATATNINGGSFIDSQLHVISSAINLEGAEAREFFADGVNITDNGNRMNWDTYTNDEIEWVEVNPVHNINWMFGKSNIGPSYPAWNLEGAGWQGDDGYIGGSPPYSGLGDRLAFVSIDTRCTLLSGIACTLGGYISDPGNWEGWWSEQPLFFYGAGRRNTGRTGPVSYDTDIRNGANTTEGTKSMWRNTSDDDIDDSVQPSRIINYGITDTIDFWNAYHGNIDPAIRFAPYVPGTDPQVALGTPHWSNLPSDGGNDLSGGNWIDLTGYSTVSFETAFGSPVDDNPRFDGAVAVNKKIEVSTNISNHRFVLTGGSSFGGGHRWTNFNQGSIVLTDAAGNIINWCWDQDAGDLCRGIVEIPADGNTYYLVATSDTGNLRVLHYKLFDEGA